MSKKNRAKSKAKRFGEGSAKPIVSAATYGVGGNAQPLTGKAQMFLGGGLHTHSVHRQAEGIGQILAHGRNVRRKLGPLTQQRRVDIFNAEAVLL